MNNVDAILSRPLDAAERELCANIAAGFRGNPEIRAGFSDVDKLAEAIVKNLRLPVETLKQLIRMG